MSSLAIPANAALAGTGGVPIPGGPGIGPAGAAGDGPDPSQLAQLQALQSALQQEQQPSGGGAGVVLAGLGGLALSVLTGFLALRTRGARLHRARGGIHQAFSQHPVYQKLDASGQKAVVETHLRTNIDAAKKNEKVNVTNNLHNPWAKGTEFVDAHLVGEPTEAELTAAIEKAKDDGVELKTRTEATQAAASPVTGDAESEGATTADGSGNSATSKQT